ncbi:SLATT domain-containing protein [Oxalobacteraceae bacterium OTU3REALA1]|nr:SLATT domain-containing protein [Oxalobacteraceae bacterium OTU3REALA1]
MEKNTIGAKTALEELRVDSKIGKAKHFNASDRKLFWHRICGVPVILANLFVGIVLVSLQSPTQDRVKLSPPSISAQLEKDDPSKEVNGTPALVSSDTANHENSSSTSALALLSILLAFSAASLSAVQTFFNFHKSSEGHRAIGNRYLHISRQCKALQQKHRDMPFEPDDIWTEYQKLYDEYHQINMEAEAFPTSLADLGKAKKAIEISPYKAPGD